MAKGSVHLRKDGRWEGRIVVGYDERGYSRQPSSQYPVHNGAHPSSPCAAFAISKSNPPTIPPFFRNTNFLLPSLMP